MKYNTTIIVNETEEGYEFNWKIKEDCKKSFGLMLGNRPDKKREDTIELGLRSICNSIVWLFWRFDNGLSYVDYCSKEFEVDDELRKDTKHRTWCTQKEPPTFIKENEFTIELHKDGELVRSFTTNIAKHPDSEHIQWPSDLNRYPHALLS